MKIEKFEIMSRERKTQRKFFGGSSSSDKRTRDSQVESIHSFATKGRSHGPTTIPGFGRSTSTE